MVLICKTTGELAQIAEDSHVAYSVVSVEEGRKYLLTRIRFAQHVSGRRNRSVVECMCNDRPARFDADSCMMIED